MKYYVKHDIVSAIQFTGDNRSEVEKFCPWAKWIDDVWQYEVRCSEWKIDYLKKGMWLIREDSGYRVFDDVNFPYACQELEQTDSNEYHFKQFLNEKGEPFESASLLGVLHTLRESEISELIEEYVRYRIRQVMPQV